jgi:probable HAF family extracellular repeat protein
MEQFRYCSLLATGLLASALSAQIQHPIYTSEGALSLIDFPDAVSTQVWSINSRGEMVGVYVSADRVTHGFLLSGGRFKTIDFPGAALTLANSINANGDTVGEYATAANGPHHGFLLSGGRFMTVDYPGASSSALVGIAANGDLVGIYDNPAHGFFVSGDTFTNIDVPGASTTVIGTISPRGDVVGSSPAPGITARAFLMRHGEIINTWDHPAAAGGFTNAIGINAAGDIVGRYLDGARVSHGYLLSNGEFTTIDCPGATFTGAAGITPDGDVVGRCTVGGVSHGFLLKRGQEARYTVTDLGTLGENASFAYGLSNSGAVSGSAGIANGDQHPFLWRDGKMTDLGTLAGLAGGNGAGQNPTGSLRVTIVSETAAADPSGEDFCGWGTHHVCLAAVWKDGIMTALPTLGGNNATAFSMNERGQIVGLAEKPTPDPMCIAPQKLAYAPVIWGPNPGDIQELRLPAGDTAGWAYGINEKGEAVGATGACGNTAAPAATALLTGRRAVLWENGVARDLGNFGGEGDTVAVGINNRTEVVGASSLPNGNLHGFLWSRENGLEDIGTVDEDANGLPSSINSGRQVVGASCDAEFNCRAFLWERYSMTDLNDLVSADSTIYMAFATWINDAGEIVGWGVDKNTGAIRAFLARPAKPSPSNGPKLTSVRSPLPSQLRSRLQQHFPAGRPNDNLLRHR